jgi:hypothetical protein
VSAVASAALPVAIGLLVCAALARAILRTHFGDEQAQESARRHLEPLCVWCLGALAVWVFAHSAAGGSWVVAFIVGGVLATVATGLWLAGGEDAPAAPPAPESPAPAPPPEERSLWSR